MINNPVCQRRLMLIRVSHNGRHIWVFLIATLLCSINIMGLRNEMRPYQSFSNVPLCVRRNARYSNLLEPVLSPTESPVGTTGGGSESKLDDSGISEVISSSDDAVVSIVNETISIPLRNSSSVDSSVFFPTAAIGLDENSTRVESPSGQANVSQSVGTSVPGNVSMSLVPASVVPSVVPSVLPSVVSSVVPSLRSPTTSLPLHTSTPSTLPSLTIPPSTPSTLPPSTPSIPSTLPPSTLPSSTSPPPHPPRQPPRRPRPNHHTPTTPPPLVPCSQIQFYNWRDGKDYRARCSAIQTVLLGSSSFFILQSSLYGGLGHKYISIQHSITYALLLRRRYRIRLPEAFWQSTVSVLQPFRDNELGRVRATELSPLTCINASPKSATVLSVLGYHNVRLTDCRVPRELIRRPAQVNLMRRLEVMQNNEDMDDFQRVLFRLLLNPTPALQSLIVEFRQKHFTKQHVFSIQMRMGGCLADTQENSEMMSLKELMRLPSVIVSGMKAWNYGKHNTVIFISSDSSYAEKYVKEALGSSYTVVTSNFFRRGHTSGRAELDATRRAIIDLFLIADSDALIVCRGSGYGKIAMKMGRAKHVIVYRVSHTKAANFDPHLGKCANVTYLCSVCYGY